MSAAVSLALLLTLFAASPVRAQLGVDGEITADPTAIRANGSDTSTITVQAKDTLGTNLLVGGDSVRMSTTAGTFPGPCTSSCLATDNGNGTYTSILTSSTSWGTATVSGTINDSLMNGEAQVSFTATALQFGVDPEDTAAGATITPAVTVRAVDGAGNTVSTFNGSITVALGNNPGGDGTLSGTKTRAAVNGVATFNDLSIDKADTGYTLTAAASGLTGDTSASFNITAGPAVALRFVQQPTNEQAGTAISPAVTVRAVDSGGNTDLNFTGNITVALGNNPGGDGTLSGTKTRAAVNGVATFNDLSIDKADTGYTLTAVASGLTDDTSASFDITPGPAVALDFEQQPTEATADATISPPVTVRAVDSGGNTDLNFTGNITVALGNNPGGDGALSGTKTRAAVNGVATFNDLSIDKADTGYTLTAAASGLTGDTSASFNITPGPAEALEFQQQPTNEPANATITPAVTVRAVDSGGNTATSFTGNITVAIGTNPGGGTLSGTKTRAAVNGVATFNNLSIDKVGNGYTLTAAASGLTGDTSNSFNITPGPAEALEFQQQPTNEQVGVAISPAVTVRAVDSGGNTATSFTGNITVAIGTNPGGGALSGTKTRAAVNGVATFNNLSIDKVGNGYTLTAAASGLTGDTSNSFNITPGPPSASTSTITAAPTVITADGTSTSTITIQLKDQFGNDLTTGGATVTVATTAGTFGGGCTSGCTATDQNNGRYTATLRSSTIAQTATVTGTVNGQAITDDATVTFAAGDADRLQFQQQPTNTTAGAAISPAVTVRAVDGNNNTVTTFNGSVTLSIGTNPGGGTLSGTTTRTAVNGVATFNDLSIDKAGTGYTLVADGGGLAGATSSAFNITPAAPSGATSTISADPDAIPADGTSTSTITVQLEDSFGNELTTGGASVTLSASAGTLSAVTDNGDGTYTASLRSSTTSQTANVTGTVNGQAIADNATVTFTSGSAASLEVLVQPSATPAGQAITPPVRVRVTDADGNTVLGFSGDITVELSESPAGGVLSGTLTTAAVDGVATFGSLSIDRAGNGYVLRFTSSGVASVSSTPFSVTAGAASPATTTITANPSAIPADGLSTATITVQTRDATGADIRSGGDAVTLTTTAGALGPVRDNGNGTYTATLTSSTSNVTATIRGTLNGASIVDTATVTFASGFADLSISVEVSDDEPSEGETVVYTVTVRNDGPDDAAGVAVSDNLPPDRLTFVSAEASQGTYNSASGVWNVGALARGASATLEITVTVNP